MCVMLYIGTQEGVPEERTTDLSVEPVEEARRMVTRWFTQPVVQYVGAHTGCSCGFPSIVAEGPVEYFEGMWPEREERADDLRSVSALLRLLRAVPATGHPIKLYPVWNGDEDTAPKGVIEWALEELVPERFFFTEQFLHVVRLKADGDRPSG
jgi:hypothetical protein